MKKTFSVKSRLTAGFVILFTILALLFTLYLASISGKVYRNTLEEDIIELVKNDMSLINGKTEGKLSLKEGFLFEYSGINVSVYNQDGALIAGVTPIGFEGNKDFKDGKVYETESGNQDFLVFDIFYPLSWEEGLWIRGVSALTDNGSILKNLVIAALLTLPIFLVMAGVFSFFIARKALFPLDFINEKAKSINNGDDLKSRINLQNETREFMELSNSMDEMLSRLEGSFEKEKQFTSDVSHELRTPVSVIKGAAEYSLKYDESPKEWRQSMEMIRKNSGEMAGMIESLLTLGRIDARTLKLNMDRVNLGVLSEMLHDGNFPDLVVLTEGDCVVFGDANLLKSIMVNLVENAYKYGGENVAVKLNLRETEEEVLLTVSDNGPGIPEEKLPHIFERFYRVDDARSNTISGSGLGLSLVNEMVKLHGGRISVKSIQGMGTEFCIFFKKSP